MKLLIKSLILLSFLAVQFPSSVSAQVQYDQFESVTILPRLSGAANLEVHMEPRLQLSRHVDIFPKTGVGVGVGYSFFNDPHGRKRFRLVANLDLAGFGEKSLLGIGGTATYAIRGYSPNFAFASFGFSAMAKFINYSGALKSYAGYETGVGVEISFGTLFYDQPYLFSGFSKSVFLTYNSANDAISIIGRVGFRFDWAFRDRSNTEQVWE